MFRVTVSIRVRVIISFIFSERELMFMFAICRRPGRQGTTENAGVENAIRSKLQGWKMQEWKMQE